jgi:hypothetical protein
MGEQMRCEMLANDLNAFVFHEMERAALFVGEFSCVDIVRPI